MKKSSLMQRPCSLLLYTVPSKCQAHSRNSMSITEGKGGGGKEQCRKQLAFIEGLVFIKHYPRSFVRIILFNPGNKFIK